MSHTLYPGSIISKTAPTVTPPVDGEGGSASGIWTIDQADYYISQGTWPKPVTPRGLWAFGSGLIGGLGLSNSYSYSSPVQVGSLTTWNTMAGAEYAGLAIKNDGTLWSWGYNAFGVLGLNNTTNYSSPKQVGALTNWKSVVSGNRSVKAIKTDGTTWAWGSNQFGNLGLGDTTNRSSPTQVGILTNWAQIAGGSVITGAIKTDGTLWMWGLNAEGQLGLGNTIYYSSPKQVGSLTNWSKIQVGDNCGIALKTDGTLWSWGGNSFGQLGLGDTVNRSSPTQIGSGTNWAQICVGNSSPVCFALKTDGTLWAWGYNQTYGALGLNDTVNRSSPTQVGALTNWSKFPTSAYKPGLLMIKSDGTLWGWGLNTDGQVGIGNTINRSSPAQIGSLTSWQKCALSYRNSFALRS